ncbi:radical SAM protein [Desulforhopalus singaporensis]|nr:radical SAM protein [Desulforhopalus singaporensis]
MTGSYVKLYNTGQLRQIAKRAVALLESCSLCPRECGVNRLQGEAGVCRTGRYARVASYGPHFGEESCLVGSQGSGTIFFCGCNLLCRFCQNYSLSRDSDPDCTEVDASGLAELMILLQHRGCHNINFVTPTHVIPQILEALIVAVGSGLTVPVVYNCSGYEKVDSLVLLENVVDIYMPDAKFFRAQSSAAHTGCADYPVRMKQAIVEMQRQVGDLVVGPSGVAERGLLVRHLLMPNGLEDTRELVRFLARTISRDCYLNIMDQYRPCGEYSGGDGPEDCSHPISQRMYEKAMQLAEDAGLRRLERKDLGSLLARLLIRSDQKQR